MRMSGTAAILLVLLAGCGSGLTESAGERRLQVTQTLREACYDFGAGDVDIRTLISLLENDRVAGGLTKAMAFRQVEVVCYDTDWLIETKIACGNCYTALIEQVYPGA